MRIHMRGLDLFIDKKVVLFMLEEAV